MEQQNHYAFFRSQLHKMTDIISGISEHGLKNISITGAENAYNGMQVLPGTGGKPYFVGQPPRWFDNPVNDNEFVWVLNRHYQFYDYAVAYGVTGDMKYAQRTYEDLVDWLKKCPCPPIPKTREEAIEGFGRPTPWRAFEAGVRMYDTWPKALLLLDKTGLLSDELIDMIRASMYDHAFALKYASPLLWPEYASNHYLVENLGLFYATLFLSDLPEIKPLQEHAMTEIGHCATVQLTHDGGQIEGCPSYHNLCIELLAFWALTAKRFGVPTDPEIVALLRRGIDYSIYTTRPNGQGVPYGDSDPDHGAVSAVVLGTVLFDDPSWYKALSAFIPQDVIRHIWDADYLSFPVIPYDAPASGENKLELPLMNRQEKLGQVMMRSDWTPEARSLFFACRIPVQNSHAHIDPATIDFTAYGKAFLCDPSRFTYRDDDDRKLFKSPEMHNTVTVGGKWPFRYVSSWGLDQMKTGSVTGASEGDGVMSASCFQTSYEPLIHVRNVGLIDGEYLVVWDNFAPTTEADYLDVYFHTDTTSVRFFDNGFVTEDGEGANFILLGSDGFKASRMDGRVSTTMDVDHPSTRCCFHSEGKNAERRDFVAVGVPFRGECPDVTAPVIDGDTVTFTVGDKKIVLRRTADGFEKTV